MRGKLRTARQDDIPRIEAIWNQIIAQTTITFTSTRKDLSGWLDQKSALDEPVIIWDQDGCTGFATYGDFRSGPGYAHIAEHSVMLAQGARGTGAGRAMMLALMEVAQAHGKAALIGGISGENTAGLGFHLAMGFTEVGRVPGAGRKFDRDLDLVLMHRRI